MILKLSNEEEQVIKFMFKEQRIGDLPPAIKDVAIGIKKAINNPRKVTKKQYEQHALNPVWRNCENCDE